MGQATRVATTLGLLALVGLLMTVPGRAEDYPTGDRDSMWSDPDTYMIGSFRHMGEIYPSRPVHRAGPVSDLPPGRPLAPPVYDMAARPVRWRIISSGPASRASSC